jgi:hypothetical protein
MPAFQGNGSDREDESHVLNDKSRAFASRSWRKMAMGSGFSVDLMP